MILSLSIIFLATGLLFPKVIGDFTYRLGMTSISVPYTRAQYDNSKDINDLSTLIDRAYQADDFQTVVDYAPKMYNHEHYLGYVEYEKNSRGINYVEYLSGIYVLSLLEVGDSDTATEVVVNYTSLIVDNDEVKYTDVIKYLVVGIDKYNPSIGRRTQMSTFMNEMLITINNLDGNTQLKADFQLDYAVVFRQLRGE